MVRDGRSGLEYRTRNTSSKKKNCTLALALYSICLFASSRTEGNENCSLEEKLYLNFASSRHSAGDLDFPGLMVHMIQTLSFFFSQHNLSRKGRA